MGTVKGGQLYRIGSDWIFDANSLIGYKVINKPNDIDFEAAFKLNTDENLDSRVTFLGEVPIGVVRRALHIMKLKEDGKLNFL